MYLLHSKYINVYLSYARKQMALQNKSCGRLEINKRNLRFIWKHLTHKGTGVGTLHDPLSQVGFITTIVAMASIGKIVVVASHNTPLAALVTVDQPIMCILFAHPILNFPMQVSSPFYFLFFDLWFKHKWNNSMNMGMACHHSIDLTFFLILFIFEE